MKSPGLSLDERAYLVFLKNLDLTQLRMSECSVKAHVARPEPKGTSLKMTLEATLALKEQGFSLRHDYILIFGGEGGKPEAGRMRVAFEMAFHCKEPVDAKALKLFAGRFRDVNAPLITWPHYREFVQSMTGRMQWPPLVLPLMTAEHKPKPAPPASKPAPKKRPVKR